MKYQYLPIFKGVFRSAHKRIIPDDKLSTSTNVFFDQGKMKKRWGYSQLGTNLPLNGSITNLTWYEQLGTANKWLLAFTTRDSYRYDSSAGLWYFITQKYITGTAQCSGGTTVTGTTTSWDYTNWPEEVWQIKFGTQDVNGTGTPNTWYTIDTWTDATHLELTANGPTTGSSVNYVIRRCWTDDADSPHSVCLPILDNDRIVVATNGWDAILKWDGTAEMETLGGSPNLARHVGFFGDSGGEQMFLGWTVDQDSGADQPCTIELSGIGDPEWWTIGENGAAYYDFLNTNDEVEGIVGIAENVAVYKSKSISIGGPTGDVNDPFSWKQNAVQNVGTRSINTVADTGKYHIFFADENVYMFDGINVTPIGGEVMDEIIGSMKYDKIKRSFALCIPEYNMYILFIPVVADYPDYAYVLDYASQTWTTWQLNDYMTAGGYWYSDQSQSWSQLDTDGTTWSQLLDTGKRWNDMLSYGGKRTYVVGDSEGYVYEFGTSTSDDGVAISCDMITKDYPLNDVKQLFNLNEVVVGFEGQSSGTIKICASIDHGVSWSEWRTIDMTSSAEYLESIVNFALRGRQVRFRIQNISGSYFEIESLNVGFNDSGA
jgi:hypothetical protein